MLEVISFILGLILEFLYMLFDIDIGFTSLGIFMCVTFIFLPMILSVVNFLKRVVIDEYDDRHDFGKLFGGDNGNVNKGNKKKKSKKY